MSENNILNNFKQFFLITIAPIAVKFQMKHDQTPGFQNCKIGSGQESKMATITKNSKNFKKKITAELGHSNQMSVYKSNFAQMPISQENMNVFWSNLITMVAEWNHFIFVQMLLLKIAQTRNNISRTTG